MPLFRRRTKPAPPGVQASTAPAHVVPLEPAPLTPAPAPGSAPAAEPADTKELPYGGTFWDYRRQVAERAAHAHIRYAMLLRPGKEPISADQFDAAFTAAAAATDAWSVVALLRWIRERFGAEAAYDAASIAQDMGYDGDEAGLCADVIDEAEAAPNPSIALRILPAARQLLDAARAIRDGYATADATGQRILLQQLSTAADALGDLVDAHDRAAREVTAGV